MIGRQPHEIWQDSLEDGQHRLARPASVLAATGLLGGFHVTLGLLALVVTTGALTAVMPPGTAHVLASLTFGIGLVFITLGRSELFTENFLIPVAAVAFGHSSKRAVARLWAITLVLNLLGIAIFAAIITYPGVLDRDALVAAGELADTLTQRDLVAAGLSAVLAGAIITLFTWLAEAAESDLTRLFVALVIGFVLLAPSTNHSVVGFGEVLLGMLSGTSSADGLDLLRNTTVAVVGNLFGGVVLVAFVRSVQAQATRDAGRGQDDGSDRDGG
ncbi:MAG: formate/nitrite transporter family protein [Thermoleophilaceae bacterium]|nr:formate/nitrite transporter family protein [Thermoleophilaceae bacterium]